MNPFRNEAVIKLGAEEILLRPTFENIAAMESAVGAVSYLGWKYSKAHQLSVSKASLNDIIKASPPLSEIAQIIFYNQAATHPDDETKKKFSLEEIWSLVQHEGVRVVSPVVSYIATMVAGDKVTKPEENLETEEKKS